MKQLMVFMLVILLSGCFWNDKPVDVPTMIHPNRPSAVQSYPSGRWATIQIDDGVFVALEYQDAIYLLQYVEDTIRFIREQNAILCYYRKDLQEIECKQ